MSSVAFQKHLCTFGILQELNLWSELCIINILQIWCATCIDGPEPLICIVSASRAKVNLEMAKTATLNHFEGLENHHLQIIRPSKANQLLYAPWSGCPLSTVCSWMSRARESGSNFEAAHHNSAGQYWCDSRHFMVRQSAWHTLRPPSCM